MISRYGGKSLMGKGTRTSRFGVSKREGNDSTPFYDGRLYVDPEVEENRSEIVNQTPLIIQQENAVTANFAWMLHAKVNSVIRRLR